ncbi:Peptidyl-prolyl isomerase cwc27 [Actinomortierella ambigua]|nr:Peptidyl-prolyl isomerase cwc27 [Actinomortierella ambigua]
MSNIYLLEPHTSGKVVLHTTQGDIEVELWPKEAPKACRNFVQLCMEGYYDNTIFHRIVAGFIIQGGDPEGTGMGGDSIYGKPFQDEFHTRLRFVRRGLVAMANPGTPHDNRSQFFITLDATPELQNKHTIFGKIMGDTIYNVLKIGGLEVDADERPLYPPKITGCTIVVNPFDDIIPRISRAEQEAARQRELAEAKGPATAKPKKMKKNAALLSFGDDAPEEDDKEALPIRKVGSSHDALDDDPALSKEKLSLTTEKESKTLRNDDNDDRDQDREERDSKRRRTERDGDRSSSSSKREEKRKQDDDNDESYNDFDRRMREQVRERMEALKRKTAGPSSSSSSSSATSSAAPLPTSTTTTTTTTTATAAREQQRQEIEKLESDVRKMHGMGAEAEAEQQKKKRDAKKSNMSSLLDLERGKYKTRGDQGADKKRSSKKAAGKADADLLAKLAAFESKLRGSSSFSSSTAAEDGDASEHTTTTSKKKKEDGKPCELHGILGCESCQDSVGKAMKKQRRKEARLAGETLEGDEAISNDDDDDDDDDQGWMSHKLVFEKDPSKDGRKGGRSDNLDDYVVIDPLDKAADTNATLAKQKKEYQSRKNASGFDTTHQDRQRSDYRGGERERSGYGGGSGSGSGSGRDYRDRDRQDRGYDRDRGRHQSNYHDSRSNRR